MPENEAIIDSLWKESCSLIEKPSSAEGLSLVLQNYYLLLESHRSN